MLCPACETLRHSLDLSQKQELIFHPTISSLHSSSEAGCHLCRMVYTKFCQKYQSELVSRGCRVLIKTVANIGFWVSFESSGDEKSSVDVVGFDVAVVVGRFEVPSRVEDALKEMDGVDDSHTGSASSFKIASSWLAECQENHHHCKIIQNSTAPLPNRVISVGPADGSVEPFLLETGGKVGSYVTLSHCWESSSGYVKTLLSNIDSDKSKIKMDLLPQTFKDAIKVVRELGLQYLWIDSLCIIQDDIKDWEKEAALMGWNYKNSLITISAAHGKNSDAGLFVNRDPLSARPCEFEIGKAEHDGGRIHAYARDSSFQISKSSLTSAYRALPLHTQERGFYKSNCYPHIL